jgi:DNA-binding MarR family transcriptional regulator/predicted GNAT family acetyltransferase
MTPIAARAAAVRRFGRLYTQRIKALQEAFLGTGWSLTESRVIYELATRDGLAAAELARDLGLDRGYLSRMLRRFVTGGLVARQRADRDGRSQVLRLTDRGRAEFALLDARQDELVAGMLSALPDGAAAEMVEAMRRIEILLGGQGPRGWLLRGLRAGDLGWVVARHGALYAEEYGWGQEFEVLVAGIVAEAMAGFDPTREAAWIAERDGAPVGSVFVVRVDDETAKLRLLFVEPSARGLGIGARLVGECSDFARRAGYRRITLWTHSILTAARHLYAREGYRIVESAPFSGFGQQLTSEIWQLDL